MKKRIGIIGGVGPQATNYFYKLVIEKSQRHYGASQNHEYADMVVHSLPIPDFISDKTRVEEAKSGLIQSAKLLKQLDCGKLCIACNTIHILLDEIRENSEAEFISMVREVCEEVKRRRLRKVGLVGSSTTITSNLYQKTLAEYGIQTITPTKKERKYLDALIHSVIASDTTEDMIKDYEELLDQLSKSGSYPVILACTELPLVIDYTFFHVETINSIDILARATTDYYFN